MEEKGGEEMVSMGSSASPVSQGSPSQEEGSHEERGASSEASAEEEQFERTLTAVDGVAVVVGLIIGTGIFASPGVVLGHVQQVGVALLVWFVGGFLSLLGGLCFAELGTAIPSTGGDYIYLNELHPAVGFAFVWACFVVVKTGATAITSLIFARYFGSVILSDLDVSGNIDADYRIKMLAIAAIIGAMGLNIVGTQWVSKVQRLFFVSKIFAIVCVCVMGAYSLVLGDTQEVAWENMQDMWYLPPTEDLSLMSALLYAGSFGSAIIASLWAYEGFNTLNFVAGEIKNPQRNIPISIIIAVTIVVACYVAANVAYFAMLPKDVVISSHAVAISAAGQVWGTWATYPMAFLVAFSALGSLNANVMTGPRVFYAGAKNKVIPGSAWLSLVSEDFGTPYVAILLLGSVGALLLLPGSFEVLVNYFGFAAWIFYGLCGLSVIWIRLRRPQYEASFQVRPFPLIPVVFILCAVGIVLSSFITQPVGTLAVSALLLSGLPIYYLFYWRGNLLKTLYQSHCTSPEVL